MPMGSVLLLVRVLLAGIFVVAGWAKFVDRAGSRQALLDFGVPARLVPLLASLLPFAELLVAGALLPRATAWWGALGALGLFMLFTIAIGYNMALGRAPACHCFGQLHSEPVGWSTLIRNLLLAAVAGYLVGVGRTDAGESVLAWLGAISTVQHGELLLIVLIVALLLGEGWMLMQVSSQQQRILQRLEHLQAKPISESAKSAAEALSLAPSRLLAQNFHLPGLYGETMTLDFLCAEGKPVLLLFSNPACGPCMQLLPEVGRWQREYVEKLTLVLISQGSVETNREKAEKHGLTRILLQQDREVAEVYEVQGTPCAVLIRPDRTIGSAHACGADAIRVLVAQAVDLPALKVLSVTSERDRLLPMATPHSPGTGGLSRQPVGARIGKLVPAVTLPNLHGELVNLSDLRGKKTLMLFWNPHCGFCQRMLAEVKQWEEEIPQSGVSLLVISKGSKEENRALGFHTPVLLDERSTLGSAFGIHGTPMAVLLNAHGEIASEIAAGAQAIAALVRSTVLP